MEVILIFRQLTDNEKQSVLSSTIAGAEVFSLPGMLYGLSDKINTIPESLIKEAIKDLLDTIKDTGDLELNGISVSSLLTINRIPLYHYQRFRIFFLLRNEWIINKSIEYYNAGGKNLTIYLPTNSVTNFSGKIENKHSKSGNIHYVYPDIIAGGKVTVSKNYKALFNYLIFFFLRILITPFRFNNLRVKKHLIIDRSARQQCRNLVSLERKWDNHNLYPLFDSKPKGLLIISEVETPKINSSTPFPLHKYYFNGEGRSKDTLYGEWIIFKGLVSSTIRRKRKIILSEYLIKLSLIKGQLCDGIQNTSVSNNYQNCRVLEAFTSLSTSTEFYIFKYLCYERFFSKYSFSTITAIDENSPATRCILDAARYNSVKTIGIQHGNIGESQPAYLYSKNDKSKRIMADLTIVWGEYFRDFLLEKGNFPAESVKMAGQMRTDLIPKMLAMSHIFKKEISGDKRVVTFASQPIADENYRYQMAFNIFEYFRNHPDIKLILKLHPGERHSAGYYESIARDAGYVNPDIRYDIDLYELLSVSDLVITAYSTVGSETVYFGKPLIIYDPFKEDLLNYAKEGVAFMATDKQSLSELVDGILNDQIVPDIELYTRFIKKYAYAIDGKATERTINYITSAS